MKYAQLVNRGEQFAIIDGSKRYEGECVWSWEEVSVDIPRRVYPISIIVKSIRRCGLKSILPLSSAQRLSVANEAKLLLESQEPGCLFKLVELE